MPVPNQRQITIHKEPTNKANLYTANNLAALDEAAKRLQTKGGFKLYMYLAKNQDKYNFYLSSSDFMLWSGIGSTAYTSAFNELVDHGYMIPKEGSKTVYTFFDKAQKEDPKEKMNNIIVEYDPDTVKEIQEIKENFTF